MKDNANTILKTDQTQGILRLLLNDPQNKNALSDQMMIQLKDQLFQASSNDSIKVIIIAAVGDVFCSGHNLYRWLLQYQFLRHTCDKMHCFLPMKR